MAEKLEYEVASPPSEEALSETMMLLNAREEKALMRKIDWVILPFLSLLYLLSFLDRSNIGNARLAGLEKDLEMHGLMYNIALAVFFIPYAAVEIPSNIIMKRSRPSIYIPCMMLAWGAVCLAMGFVKDFGGLIATRIFLGLAEGGLFPGLAFFISQWFRRDECGLRFAIFFSAATAAGAFGGLFARGLVELAGRGGLPGWSWIFIIEGLLTLIIAFSAFWAMQDYPDKAKFLTEKERIHVQWRITQDQEFLSTGNDSKFVWEAIRDWKTWVFAGLGICQAIPIYSISLFLPTIVRDLGYKDTQAQLMSAPPYVVACVLCIIGGFWADRIRQRGIFALGFIVIGIIGFTIQLAAKSNSAKYIGCFFATSGAFPMTPQVIAWATNNTGGSMKRSTTLAFVIMCCNIASISSSFIYLPKMAPKYRPGHSVLLILMCIAGTLVIILRSYFIRENKRREAIRPATQYTDDEKRLQSDMGEYADFFRFII